jgi:mono/diheme cytochrome c family protein
VQQVLQWTGDANRLDWQRTALLEGAEAALLGAPLPGTGRRGGGNGRAGAAAVQAAAGSRGGPGGAPAFPRTEFGVPAAAPAAGRGRGNTAATPLTREPVALSQLASAEGETGKRAAAVLARLTWPGKAVEAGAAPAAAPLTPEEMKRFEAGKTLYTTLCMACHQENGQGLEKVAPSLVGSTFLLAAPHVPERILINGKEGSTGLMPPLGGVLTDDQIAGVLTYVRRSWGNQGSAVEPAGVTDVRKETTGRTRPWSEKELLELVGK